MDMLITILSGLSIAIGVVALLIGSLGLIRLPDVFCRIHAVGMIDTAGASFIILGMIIHQGFSLVSVKLLLIGIFLFFTSPIATHAVAQVAHKMGVKPVGRDLVKKSPAKRAGKNTARNKTGKTASAATAKGKS
ncbi:MAG: monovalent cation/H(+) antiporter subunit G [Candidatus Puniceispirillum sp.]|nr:monovalent cation/H(+) antiporter subunit G [Candidatus Puniceispirillum sp.]